MRIVEYVDANNMTIEFQDEYNGRVHTNYYNLKNSPGLFSICKTYTNSKLPEQKHNSLEDALVTKDVFFKFKETITK